MWDGQVTALLAAAGAEDVAVDALPAMLEGARRRAPGATFIEADLLDLEITGHFDRVVLSFVLHTDIRAAELDLRRRLSVANGRAQILIAGPLDDSVHSTSC